MQVDFNVVYGKNTINIPIEQYLEQAIGRKNTALFNKKCTIYNDIPAVATVGSPRRWDRFVIDFCSVQGGALNAQTGTVSNVVNAKTVITQDTNRYLPVDKYKELPENKRADFYTVQVNDFVVFDEVDDVVENSADWQALQTKYKNNGIKITSVYPYLNGMGVDNIMFSNG